MDDKSPKPDEGWEELWGKRIGRALGYGFALVLIYTLGRQLNWW